MNCDILILVMSLTAIVLSLVWDRATTVGPVLFAWSGASVGGVVAFFCYYDPGYDRVGIEYIVPFATLGAVCGLVPGSAVHAAYLRGGNRRKAALEAISAAALSAGLGMIVGWIIHRRDDDAVLMAFVYGVVFALIGAVLALLNWWIRDRSSPVSRPIVVAENEER